MSEVNWSIVEEQMSLNKSYRIKWKAYLGNTLNRVVARLKVEGNTADEAYRKNCDMRPDLPEELKRKLKIGVAARFGETGTYDSEKKRNDDFFKH